jgi:glycosyltransferase involved in cell wall biosynthesis
MASGTAVIANHTSDLAIHLRHRETGIVVIDDSVDAVAAALDEVADGGHQLAADLGRAAREEAMSAFDYRNHAETMDQFVRRAVEAGS